MMQNEQQVLYRVQQSTQMCRQPEPLSSGTPRAVHLALRAQVQPWSAWCMALAGHPALCSKEQCPLWYMVHRPSTMLHNFRLIYWRERHDWQVQQRPGTLHEPPRRWCPGFPGLSNVNQGHKMIGFQRPYSLRLGNQSLWNDHLVKGLLWLLSIYLHSQWQKLQDDDKFRWRPFIWHGKIPRAFWDSIRLILSSTVLEFK